MGTVETTAASDGAADRAVARPATLALLLAALVVAALHGRLFRPTEHRAVPRAARLPR